LQIHAFGQELADEAVGVLIEAALPAMVWGGKVIVTASFGADLFVAAEFGAIIMRDGEHGLAGLFKRFNHKLGAGFSALDGHGLELAEGALALDERDDAAAMFGADDGVGFPVAGAGFFFHDLRSFADVGAIWDEVTLCCPAFFVTLAAMAQTAQQLGCRSRQMRR